MPLTPGDMPTRPEKASPAIQHPQVILHTLRQLGTQHLRPELETRVRTGETEAWIEAAFTPADCDDRWPMSAGSAPGVARAAAAGDGGQPKIQRPVGKLRRGAG